ncbi:DUF929 domain-containing protein [Candidatus Marsarchaeota archaeon]|nr:DUF929 domain-containing protein [Candidatus Marsarchaeota archaeon]
MNKKVVYGIIVVIVIIAAAVLVFNSSSSSPLAVYDGKPVNQSQIVALESIAANTGLANKIGAGVDSPYPTATSGYNVTMVNGKPTVIYIGAEYCPFCAVFRWGAIIALMRFGNFSSLHYMTSSSDNKEPFTSVPTFTFYNSTYSSRYITFLPVEVENNTYGTLQQPSQLQAAAAARFDSGGSIPFIDFGNQSIQIGIPQSISPGYIKSLNWGQIIDQIGNSNTTISQAVLGEADVFTAEICKIDNFTPASVCSQPYVRAIVG